MKTSVWKSRRVDLFAILGYTIPYIPYMVFIYHIWYLDINTIYGIYIYGIYSALYAC